MSRRRRKPVYRNWWVWLIVIVAVVIVYLFASGERIPEEEIQRDGAEAKTNELFDDFMTTPQDIEIAELPTELIAI